MKGSDKFGAFFIFLSIFLYDACFCRVRPLAAKYLPLKFCFLTATCVLQSMLPENFALGWRANTIWHYLCAWNTRKMKHLLQLLTLSYALIRIAFALQDTAIPSNDTGSNVTVNHQSQGAISCPQDQPALFLHKVSGGEQVLTEQIRLQPDKNYRNQLAQARKPSLFITEFTRQILHQRAVVPLFIKGRALLC